MSKIVRKAKNFMRRIEFIHKPYSRFVNERIHKRQCKRLHSFGYKIVAELSHLLTDNQYHMFFAYGVLLGFIRDGGFIEYDDDLDVVIVDNPSFSWDSLEDLLVKNGYKKIRYFSNQGIVTEQVYEKDGLSIDFFRYFYEDDHLYGVGYRRFPDVKYQFENERTTYKCVFPLVSGIKFIKIKGYDAAIPENYEDLLEKWYGPTWKTPIKGFVNNQYDLYETTGEVHICG